MTNYENVDMMSMMAQLHAVMQNPDKAEALRVLKEKFGDDIPVTEDDLKGPMDKQRIHTLINFVKPKLSTQQQVQLDFMMKMFLK